jgi:hypothetical protein
LQNSHLLPPSIFFLSSMEERGGGGRGGPVGRARPRAGARRGHGLARVAAAVEGEGGYVRRADRAEGIVARWRDRGEGRERGCAGRRNMKNHATTMEVFLPGETTSLEPWRKPSIDGDSEVRSMNRIRLNKALDKTNAAVPSDSAADARIGSNCSPELSSELEPLRTSVSNSGS